MSFMSGIRDLKRISHIANIFAKHGLGYFTAELGLKYHLKFTKKFVSFEKPISVPSRMRASMEELGGAFVKLGQILSLRPDLVPPEYSEEFSKLQDNVAPLQFKIVKKVIEKEFGKPLSSVFETFDEVPIGSASVAQVHKASLKNRKIVVVKVMRPEVKEEFGSDISIMHYFAKKFQKKRGQGHIDLNQVVDEFERYTKKELDFRNEAENIKKFYSSFEKSKFIKIPKIYDELCSEKVLVMEYIDGIKLKDYSIKSIVAKKSVVHNLVNAVVSQIFEMDIFHADLHPGNILVLHDKRIALLDFGIVGSLGDSIRSAGIDMVVGLTKNDSESVYNAMLKVGTPTESTNYEKFKKEVNDIVGEWNNTSMKNEKVTAMLHRLFNSALRNDIEMPSDMVLFAKAMVTVEGACMMLYPKFNFSKEIKPNIMKIAKKKARDIFSYEYLLKAGADAKDFAKDFSDEFVQLIRRFKHGKIRVEMEDTDIQRLSNSINTSSNRMTYGIIFAALMLSGTAFAFLSAGADIKGISFLTIICFIAAIFMFFAFIISLIKEKSI